MRGTKRAGSKDLLSIDNLSNRDIDLILTTAERFRDKPPSRRPESGTVALYFEQGSTRTRLGFEAAAQKLGLGVIDGFDQKSRYATGIETFDDHIRVLSAYADVIVARSPIPAQLQRIAALTARPVINGGNGMDEHPTQALADLFTIRSLFPKRRIETLTVALSGDPTSRHLRPFVKLLARHPPKEVLFCHGNLARNKRLAPSLFALAPNITFAPVARMEDMLHADVISLCTSNVEQKTTGRMPNKAQVKKAAEREPPAFVLNAKKILTAKSKIKILHPLPREGELDVSCDALPNNAYFRQMELSIFTRMALLHLVARGHRWRGR
jgi:aspartate carbamoyltransferase catalytic subunit